MKIGSLFSGIGGLELGLEWSGVGSTLWQVEQSEFCRKVLAQHWPEARRFIDVREVGAATLPPVDLVCGGFPCQDISSAGRGAGLAGERSGLWFEFARIVEEMEPRWVVVENVASGANRWVNAVVSGLEQLGYEAFPFPVSAADVGAPHLRRRIFVVAYADSIGSGEGRPWGAGSRDPGRESEASEGATADAKCQRLQERGGTGATEEAHARTRGARGSGDAADAECTRLQGSSWEGDSGTRGTWGVSPGSPWADDTMPEPAIRRMDDGVPHRVDRLRALGNAVVPQCAEVIGHVILELEKEIRSHDPDPT